MFCLEPFLLLQSWFVTRGLYSSASVSRANASACASLGVVRATAACCARQKSDHDHSQELFVVLITTQEIWIRVIACHVSWGALKTYCCWIHLNIGSTTDIDNSSSVHLHDWSLSNIPRYKPMIRLGQITRTSTPPRLLAGHSFEISDIHPDAVHSHPPTASQV